MKKFGLIKFVVLISPRNKEIADRIKNCEKFSNVLCSNVRCTEKQFVSGEAHNAVLIGAQKLTADERNDSWENYDFCCFDELESKNFISKKVWKNKNWKTCQILDLTELDKNLTEDAD